MDEAGEELVHGGVILFFLRRGMGLGIRVRVRVWVEEDLGGGLWRRRFDMEGSAVVGDGSAEDGEGKNGPPEEEEGESSHREEDKP